jgi:hypothetical protein
MDRVTNIFVSAGATADGADAAAVGGGRAAADGADGAAGADGAVVGVHEPPTRE